MKVKKMMAVLLAAVLALATLAGCNSSSNQSTPAASGSEAAPATKFIADEVTIANGDPVTFSPFRKNGDGKNPLCEVYETLCVIDGFGGDLKGVLAKDWHWEGNDLIVELYDYIYDSLGNNITAEDVKFCYETSAEKGVFQIRYESNTNGCEVLDTYKFVLHFKNADSFNTEIALLTNQFIWSKKAWEESGDELSSHSAGTGPYVLKSFEAGASATLERRDDYWQKDESKINAQLHANVKTINYKFITENSQILNSLIAGEIDYATDINQEAVKMLETYPDFTVTPFKNQKSWCLYPNCWETSPMSDINVRAAVFYAINADDIIKALGGDQMAKKTMNFGKVEYNGYSEEYDKQDDSYYWVSDINIAKDYLNKSAYKDQKLTLTIAYESGPYSAQLESTALVIGSALNALGIDYKINPVDTTVFTELYQNEARYGEWDMIIRVGGISGWYMDLFNVFDNRMNTNGLNNMYKTGEEEFQKFIEKAYTNSGNTKENFDYMVKYLKDGFYAYHLFETYSFEAYRNALIKDVSVKTPQLWILPGAWEYVEK